jgi:hypothetical protein
VGVSAGGGAHELRMQSVVGRVMRTVECIRLVMSRSRSTCTAVAPSLQISRLTTVRGGSISVVTSVSSKPMTDSSRGIRRQRIRTTWRTPTVSALEVAKIAVGGAG